MNDNKTLRSPICWYYQDHGPRCPAGACVSKVNGLPPETKLNFIGFRAMVYATS